MLLLTILHSLYLLRSLTQKQDRCGLDERIVCSLHEIKFDNVTIEQIMKIQEKSEKLDFLKSNQTSDVTKLYEIGNKNIPTIINIFNGGLLDDWNFEILM